jgi:hypothetical protein
MVLGVIVEMPSLVTIVIFKRVDRTQGGMKVKGQRKHEMLPRRRPPALLLTLQLYENRRDKTSSGGVAMERKAVLQVFCI